MGDQLLIAVARRLTNVLRPEDTVARIGGDEFLVICPGVSTAAHVDLLGVRILDALGAPVLIEGVHFRVGLSLGIAISELASRPDTLIRAADAAMYAAKDKGKNRFEIYRTDVRHRAVRRVETATDLERALDRDEFRVFYQPTVDLRTNRLVGVEALLRCSTRCAEFSPRLSSSRSPRRPISSCRSVNGSCSRRAAP